MKAWFGEAATKENDWAYGYLPMLTGDHSHMTTVTDMADGKVKGYFVMGENPVVGSMNGPLQRKGLRALDWLVVRDFQVTETADFWRESAEDVATEVFFFPAATHTEKDGLSPTRSAYCNGIIKRSSRPARHVANSILFSNSDSF